ncbi:hypothetical protein GQ42DRAFT_160448 [Ramicandelaber brevisporus]|nr:hypothetical protein GQ42DRAFT_160448 [Ramicandelaber brevisporus]
MALDNDTLIAYGAIGTMAIVPIIFGSFGTLDKLKLAGRKERKAARAEADESSSSEDEETEAVSSKDAYMFPLYGSAMLASLYVVVKYLRADLLSLLITAYFTLISATALTATLSALITGITQLRLARYHLRLSKRVSGELFSLKFTNVDIVAFVLGLALTAAYSVTKHWILNNIIGLSFSYTAIKLIRLDSFRTGMILLSGLFIYDIFWVFGTDVMVTVAKGIDGPIKVVFPKQPWPLLEHKKDVTMLGLGDIVMPGIFLAMSLRFDRHLFLEAVGYSKDKKTLPAALNGQRRPQSFSKVYFVTGFAAYVAGLATTIFVMHTFKAAQPALLYLSPACILSVLVPALFRGQLGAVFAYSEETEESEEDKKKKEEKESAADAKKDSHDEADSVDSAIAAATAAAEAETDNGAEADDDSATSTSVSGTRRVTRRTAAAAAAAAVDSEGSDATKKPSKKKSSK